jgi:hypothetical protein
LGIVEYGRGWDRYVERHDQEGWPGDEWGEPDWWEALFDELFRPFVTDWKRAVEIGQGSGKYTLKVLAESEATIRAYDVSARFLGVCEERCRDQIEAGRLSLHLIGEESGQMLSELDDWRREIDAFYSIDSMVHVDLQDLIPYLLTAALVLRQGGKLILTLADATTPQGFKKLLTDIRLGPKTGKFEWVSPDIAKTILPRLGFEIDLLREAGHDLSLVATLRRPRMAEGLEKFLSHV